MTNLTSSSVNLYEILGVSRSATNKQICTAYRRQALKCHPDKGGNIEHFNQLSKAYQILSNPTLRHQYDKSQPIPESILLPSLKVFSDCFNQWLQQSPLLETLFKDNCSDVLKFLSNNHDHPLMKMVINSLVGDLEPITINHVVKFLWMIYFSRNISTI